MRDTLLGKVTCSHYTPIREQKGADQNKKLLPDISDCRSEPLHYRRLWRHRLCPGRVDAFCRF